jgi:hypothetical protein
VYDTIRTKLVWPTWAMRNERYKRLTTLGLLLDGKFYNHLPYAFHQEKDSGRNFISVVDRRPSVRYNLLKEVATRISRKLWAGPHFPRLVHTNKNLTEAAEDLMQEGKLADKLLLATRWGSVGSVAIAFRIIKGCIVYYVWRPQDCDPRFDAMGELDRLRWRYITSGTALLARGLTMTWNGRPIVAEEAYWYIQDLTRNEDLTYYPLRADEWDPTSTEGRKLLRIDDPNWSVVHNLGFVQAQWFTNLSGGEYPDGDCTWEPAVNTSIHLEYTLSMLGRGIWYNSAPQVVLKGEMLNQEEMGNNLYIKRGPANLIQIDVDRKMGEGEATSGADVKLLEMNGAWIAHAMEYIKEARQLALEQIQSSRKDPDNITGTMSGKAMELLEDDTTDLLMEMRTNYGDNGFLPLLRHSLEAAKKARHPAVVRVSLGTLDDLHAQWPLPFQPDPQDLQVYTAALQIAAGLGFVDPETAAIMWQNYADVPESANASGKRASKPQLELIHGPEPSANGKGAASGASR